MSYKDVNLKKKAGEVLSMKGTKPLPVAGYGERGRNHNHGT